MAKNLTGKAMLCKTLVCSAPVMALLAMTAPSAAASAACSSGIDRVQADFDAALARRAATGPTAKQSEFATLRRQPTPETVARAEAAAGDWQDGTRVVDALRDARNARARGDDSACLEALEAARGIIRESSRD